MNKTALEAVRPLDEILSSNLPALLSPEEKLIWLLGDLMNAVENYFGHENPKRLGHINSSAIRILDEIVQPLRDELAGHERALAAMMLRQSLATGHGDTFDDLLRELEWQIANRRSTAPAPAEGVTVRPLRWPPTCPRGQRVHGHGSPFNAEEYSIAHYGGDTGDAIYRWAANRSSWSEPCATYEQAKAAAQADYAARIRSALLPSESAEKAGVVGWRDIENDPPPHDVPVLLWSPPSLGWPNGQIEARPFSTGRSGPGWSEYSQHSWATKWVPLPAAPALQSEARDNG